MTKKVILYSASLLALIILGGILLFFKTVNNVTIRGEGGVAEIKIRTGADYNEVLDSLNSRIVIKNKWLFNKIAEKKKYTSAIKAGRYHLSDKMSYLNIINVLRSGTQIPVRVTFNNVRTIFDLAGKVGGQIEADSSEIADFLKDESKYRADGFSRETVISVFIPDTYELWWNTSAETLYKRMLKEYASFWNEERRRKAAEIKLTPIEVTTLASIIDEETTILSEKPKIAGVYLNRLSRKIKLDADPTIKFALNDFSLTRVLSKHLLVDSPYNTYKHAGLPPGPIACPTISTIDAVLSAEKNDYLFFVAKPDFSGYNNYSKTLTEHSRFAAQYQKELDKRKIFK
jgi:UPF0755 protein